MLLKDWTQGPEELGAFVCRARLGRLRGHAIPVRRDHMVSVEIVHAKSVRQAPFRLPLSLLHVPSARQENTKPALGRRAASPARPGNKPLEEVLTNLEIVFVGPGT
jgi:hypothetical protein